MFEDMFNSYIKDGLSKAQLLDMLENIKARNTPSFTVITDEEYNTIKARIGQLAN